MTTPMARATIVDRAATESTLLTFSTLPSAGAPFLPASRMLATADTTVSPPTIAPLMYSAGVVRSLSSSTLIRFFMTGLLACHGLLAWDG